MRILTALFVCLCLQATAQNPAIPEGKYIDVTVTDSIVVSPDRIEYILLLQDENMYATEIDPIDDYSNYDYADQQRKREEEKKARMKIQEKQLTDLLKKEKVDYKISHEEGGGYLYAAYLKNESKSFVINFRSYTEMNNLLEKIPETIKYSGFVSQVSCSRQQELEDKLLEKTLKKAEKQARKIAAVSGVHLGSLQQYSDNGDNIVKSIEQLLQELMRNASRKNIMSATNRIVLTKTVRVRYAIN